MLEVLLAKGAKLEATNEVNGRCCWAQTHSYSTWVVLDTVMVYSGFVINAHEWWVQVCASSPIIVSCVRCAALWCSCYMLPDP